MHACIKKCMYCMSNNPRFGLKARVGSKLDVKLGLDQFQNP